jgi:hypothetical protein
MQGGGVVSETERALKWALGDDTGISSNTICAHMTGTKVDTKWGGGYPNDPSDLGRCLRLLMQFPSWQPRMIEMAKYGPGWSGLVKQWDALATSMEEEVGICWEKGTAAPKTFKMMKLAIADGYRSDPNYSCIFSEEGHLRYAEHVKQPTTR